MRRSAKALAIVGAAAGVWLGGCQRTSGEEERQRAQLAWIDVSRAESDADKAVAAGDRRLYGVYGFSVEMHGAPESAAYEPNGCCLKMIEGTSDVVYSDEVHHRPREYAARYNQRVLSRTNCLAR